MKILIVDDEQKNIILLKDFLTELGHDVMAAENGKIALEMASENPPEIVISDILMPVMDGFKLCQEWKKDSKLKNIPFVFYTATYTSEEDKKFALSLGADQFIVKPTPMKKLIEIVSEINKDYKEGKYPQAKRPKIGDETAILKEHFARMSRKLEQKLFQLGQSRQVLQESEEKFRALTHNAMDAIILMDNKGCISYWNPAAEKIFGYKKEEAIGKQLHILLDPKRYDEAYRRVFKEFKEIGQEVSVGKALEFQAIRKDGIEFPIELSLSAIQIKGKWNVLWLVRDIVERKKAEESLRQNEEKLRLMFESAGEGIVVIDLDNKILDVNQAVVRIHGYDSREELIGKSALDLCSDEDRDRANMNTRRRLEEGLIGAIEYTMVRKDGSKFPAEVNMATIRDVHGVPIGYIGIVMDITERKEAEEALRASEERFSLAVQGTNDGIFDWDIKNNSLYWSPRMKELLGYADDELEVDFKSFISHLHPDDIELTQKAIEAHLKDRVPYNVESRLHTKSGEYRWFLTRGEAVWDEAGNPIRMVGSSTDITERKLAEEEFRKLSLAVEQSPVSIVITDTKGNIEYANPKFAEVTGYTCEEAIGKNPSILKSGEHLPEFYKQLWKTITSGQEWRGEFHNKNKDGQLYWESASISPIKNEKGVITHFLGVKEDITERKRLEKQLIQAQKMEAIGTLAGGVAHDFNNLLSVIIGYSDFMLMKLDKQDKMYQQIEEVRKAGQRAATLTHQLLAFSRRQQLQPKVLYLNTVVTEMEKMLRRLIGEDIELITGFEPALRPVKADHGQVEQVLMNLAINARDAMSGGGKLTIKTENVTIDEHYCKIYSYAQHGSFVCLSVTDTGIGMDKETISHIFEPFFTTKEVGTGLGLSVIYGIVKQHEGWINVYSEPGQGTVFKVYLQALSVKGQEEAEEKVSLKSLQGRGERILLVEDEEMLREFTTSILCENGYEIFKAENAAEALDIFEREKGEFCLVFSDVVLPDKTGIELVEHLLSKKPELKVLLASGYLDAKSQWTKIQERGFNFVQKPYTLADLLQALKKAIKQH